MKNLNENMKQLWENFHTATMLIDQRSIFKNSRHCANSLLNMQVINIYVQF